MSRGSASGVTRGPVGLMRGGSGPPFSRFHPRPLRIWRTFLPVEPNQLKLLEKSSSPQMQTEEVPQTKKIMKIYVPDEPKEKVSHTQRSKKTSLLRRKKEEPPSDVWRRWKLVQWELYLWNADRGSPSTKKSEKTSPPKRAKDKVSQPMTAEVVWSSENFILEMSTRVKNTRITNEEYYITLREGARPLSAEKNQ